MINILQIAAVAFPLCSPQVVAGWQKGWDINALPPEICIMQTDTGQYYCGKTWGGCTRYPPDLENKEP